MKEENLKTLKAISAILESVYCAGSGIKYTTEALEMLVEAINGIIDEEEQLYDK